MLHTSNPIIKHKAGLLNLAEELGNVSQACKIMGVSRDTFYRYQELVEEGGIEALLNQNKRVPNPKNRVDEATEKVVVDYAIDYPAHGQHRTSNELRKQGVFVSGSGVRSIWLRHGIENFKKRLTALEKKLNVSAKTISRPGTQAPPMPVCSSWSASCPSMSSPLRTCSMTAKTTRKT